MPVLRQPPGGWGLGAGREGGAGGPSLRRERRARRLSAAALWAALPLHVAGAIRAGAPVWVALVAWLGLAASAAVLESAGGRRRGAPVIAAVCLSSALWLVSARGDGASAGAFLAAGTSLVCLAAAAENPRAAKLIWPAGLLAGAVAWWAPGGVWIAFGLAASAWAPMETGRRRRASPGLTGAAALAVPIALALLFAPTPAKPTDPPGWAAGLAGALTGFPSAWLGVLLTAMLLIGIAGAVLEGRFALLPPLIGAAVAAAVTGAPVPWIVVLPLLMWVIYDVPAEWTERIGSALPGAAGRLLASLPLLVPFALAAANLWAIISALRK